MPICARCHKEQDYYFSGPYCDKCEDEIEYAATRAKQLSEISEISQTVSETTLNLAPRIGRLEFVIESIAKRLDLLIETTTKLGAPPPQRFYNDLQQWMQHHSTPHHIAITGLSPAQTLGAVRALQGIFPQAMLVDQISCPNDLVSALANAVHGGFFILPRPELWSNLANQMLQASCSTFMVDTTVGDGPEARSLRLNLPEFRAIILTARKEYLPDAVAVVWPTEEGIDIVQSKLDHEDRTNGSNQ